MGCATAQFEITFAKANFRRGGREQQRTCRRVREVVRAFPQVDPSRCMKQTKKDGLRAWCAAREPAPNPLRFVLATMNCMFKRGDINGARRRTVWVSALSVKETSRVEVIHCARRDRFGALHHHLHRLPSTDGLTVNDHVEHVVLVDPTRAAAPELARKGHRDCRHCHQGDEFMVHWSKSQG